ncbi:hypothetical protein HID58_019736, partial [Brassica napus]
TFLIPRFG